MYGFGEPSGVSPDKSLGPVGNELPVYADHFAWGFGDPVLSTWVNEIDWGFGDPETLTDDGILWVSPNELPDDGGEIITLLAQWPEIGPYTVKCIQTHTGQQFPEATAPLPFCNSPVPGQGEKCFTNIVETTQGGVIIPAPGSKLRFVLPILPPGIYDIELTPPNGANKIYLYKAMEIIWSNRATQVYMIKNRWPNFFSAGQRTMRYEDFLGYDKESEEEIT